MQNILLSVITGTAAGYITNDIAIDMLFNKYFGKFGGVIVDTRDDFEKNVSQLIEDEIINHHTLAPQFKKEEFKIAISKVIDTFYKEELYKNSYDRQISDIEKLDVSLNNIKKTFKDSYEPHINKVCVSIFSNVYIKEIFDDRIYEGLSDFTYSFIIKNLKENFVLENFINDLTKEHSNKNIAELVSSEPVKLLSYSINKSFEGFHKKLDSTYKKDLDNLIENLYESMEMDALTTLFFDKLLDKKIIDILGIEKALVLIEAIKIDLKNFLNSENGIKIIESLSELLLDVLKNQDYSLKEVLNDKLDGAIYKYFENQLPSIIENLIKWLRGMKGDFERAIEDSVDNVIDSYGGIKKSILKIVRNVFISDISKKYEIVEKIVDYLDNNKDDSKLSSHLSSMVLKYVSETKISEIVSYSEKKGIVNKNILYNVLKFNVDKIIQEIPNDSLIKFFDIKTKALIPNNSGMNKVLNKYIRNEVTGFVNNYIKNEKFEKEIIRIVKNEIEKINEMALSQVSDKIPHELIVENLYNIIENKKKDTVNKIAIELKNSLQEKTLIEIIPSSTIDSMSKVIHQNLNYFLNGKLDDFEQSSIEEILVKINSIENIGQKTSLTFLNLLDSNLDKIFTGNIKNIVSKNIHNLDNNELNAMMKDFMGTELKKINVAGAVLGGVVGGGVDLLASKYSGPSSVLINIPIYSIIGILTNFIAIKMIFKPYNKVFGLQGVIPKGKSRFAKNMANFVDERLLNKELSHQLFEEKKSEVLAHIKNQISEQDFNLITSLISDNSDEIFEICFETISLNLSLNKVSIGNKITEGIENIDLSKLNLDALFEKISLLKAKLLATLEKNIYEYINTIIKTDKSITDLCPEDITEHIYNMLKDKINILVEDRVISNFNVNVLKKQIFDIVKNKENILDNKLSSFNNIDSIKLNIEKYIGLISEKEEFQYEITKIAENIILKEIAPEKRIDQLFDGKLINILKDNIDNLIDLSSNSILNFLKEEKISLASEAKYRIKNEMKTNDNSSIKEKLFSFITKVSYDAFNVDDVVNRVVSEFIDEKSTRLIKKGRADIEKIIIEFINNFGNSQVKQFSLELNKERLLSLIKSTLQNQKIICTWNQVSDSILENILSKSAKFYLEKVGIKRIEDILYMFEDDINDTLNKLKSNIDKNSGIIVNHISDTSMIFINKEILNKPLCYFTSNITEEELKTTVSAFYKSVFKSSAFDIISTNFISTLKTESKYVEPRELFKTSYLNENIISLLSNNSVLERLKIELMKESQIITIASCDLISSLEKETKNDILDLILSSFIESISKHIFEILELLDISETTEKEINSMNAKELEELFMKIAGKYFSKLIGYGWIGAFFGINNILGIILSLGYAGKKKIPKTAKEKILLKKQV